MTIFSAANQNYSDQGIVKNKVSSIVANKIEGVGLLTMFFFTNLAKYVGLDY